jgi:hypothetical protein
MSPPLQRPRTMRISKWNLIITKKQTIIILHASRLAKNVNLFVESTDTDVALLLMFHKTLIPNNRHFITGTKNLRRPISISKMCSKLQTQQLSALLGMHAFTGSDTTGKFAGRTKEWAFKAFARQIPKY